MKKALSLIAILCMALLVFTGCDAFVPSTDEKPCEHNWTDATCTAPKTCSECGETDGAALGHNAIEVFGQAPTCTEPGQTNFVYCDVCDKNLSEAKEIAPLGHTEETVAGKPATCTEAGKTEGKKCSVCGVTTLEQTVIEALGHKAGEDDGDVTTAVTCERCDYVFVEAKEAITLTIPTFENGAVVADKMNYAIGDTVKLTINPDWGYAQNLYINGEPLMLDWNNNVYSFVAEKDTYVLNGTFEQGLNLNPSDAARWETGNQAHGILTTYYPANNDSWWMAFKGNYNSLTVKVQNHFPIADTKDNFFVYLRVTMENGNTYNFRIGTDKGGYTAYNRAGIQNPGDASADWSHWKNLSKLDSKITAEGVEFKVERQGANTLVITVDGEVVDTYTMSGITAEDKIASVDVKHQGNKGKYVNIVFSLALGCNHTWVDATCTAPKTCSSCKITIGEKLDHTYTNYVSNNDATCTADGTKTGTCVCGEKNTIADEGSALGHTEATVAGKDATCTDTGLTEGKKCSVCGVITVEQSELPANGHTDDDKNYKCDVCEANLCTDHVEEIIEGKDATCTETGLTEGKKCSICGSIMLEQEIIPASGHKASADDGDCTTAVKCANNGCDYIFVAALEHVPAADDGDVTTAVKCTNEGCTQILVPAKEAITLTIPTFENGAVTADKKNYAIGDTVTLTIAPAGGYFQKLYINDEPLLLDWKTKVYSFVAEKDTYVIDGSFEPTLEVYAGDWGRWDNANQAHGLLSAYYPGNNDAWWFKIKGDYNSFAINAKNYRDVANSYEGGPDGGWRIALYMQLDNGNYYAFSMWIDAGQKYAYNHYGGKIAGEKDSVTTWGGAWRELAVVNPEATAALNGNGAEFKLERIDGNHIQVTFGGIVLETYEIPGVTAANKVVSVGLHHWGNKGARVDIPFALTVPTVEEEPSVPNDDVTLAIGEFANGTVTADKDSYKIGETVTLTIAPAGGYFQKLYVNGEPLMLDWKTFTYSFTATENTYEITGSFEKGLNLAPSDWSRWDDHNQAHGVLTTYYPANNDSWWMAFKGNYNSLTVKVQNHFPIADTKDNFFVYLRVTMENGNTYNFRIGTDKGGYTAYNRAGIQNPGDASADWGNWKNLSRFDGAVCGEGVDFKVERTGENILTLSVNGEVVDTYTMNGITAGDKIASIDVKYQGNQGKYITTPIVLTAPTAE